jgi:hypothetical protein
MKRDLSLARQDLSDSLEEGTWFRQSRQSRPELPAVSDRNYRFC